MKKIILNIVLIFCLTNTVYSQKPKKIFKYIQNNEIDLAIAELAKFNAEKKYKNEELILFDISRCLLMIEFKSNNYNPILANNNFNNISIPTELQNQIFNFLKEYSYEIYEISNNIYLEIISNSKRTNTIDNYKSSLIELQKSLNNDLINQGKRLLDNKIFQDIKSQKSINLVIQYINQYSNSLVLQEAINYRDSLILSVTPKSYESLQDYINTYPNSIYSNEIKIDLSKIKYYEINLKKFKKNNDEECYLYIRNIDKLLGEIEVIQDSVWFIDTVGNFKVYPYYVYPYYEDGKCSYLRNESYIVANYRYLNTVRGVINVPENVPDSILIIPVIYSYSHNDLFIVSLNKGGEIYKKGVYKVTKGKAKLIIPVKYEEIRIYNNLLLVQLNGKQGLIDLNGNLLTDIVYDNIGSEGDGCNGLISETNTNIMEVEKNGKKGLIDSTGKLITPLIYDEIESFSEGLSGVRVIDKWGFINEKGNTVVPVQFYSPNRNALSVGYNVDIFKFENGLSIVHNNNKFGLINKNGKLIFPCKLDAIGINFNGTSTINFNGKYGLINQKGQYILPCKFDYIEIYDDEKSIIGIKGKYGLINNKGEIVIPIIYESLRVEAKLTEFKEGTYIIASLSNLSNKTGVLNLKGEIIIPFIYKSISINRKGYFSVWLNNNCGLLNKYGKQITPIKYDWIHDFNFLKLAEVRINGKNGLINEFGVQITEVIYDEIYEFSKDGYAEIIIGKKKGLIDYEGNQITQVKYDYIDAIIFNRDSISYSRKGLWIVRLNDKQGLINELGLEVTDLKYSRIEYITNNIISVTIETGTNNDDYKKGLIDTAGKEITPVIYQEIDDYSFLGNNFCVKLNDKVGLIDFKGKEIVPIKYDKLLEMDSINNLIISSLNRKIGCVNFSGKEVIPFIYDEIMFTNYKSNFLVVINGKIGVIDIKGEIIIPPIYDEIKFTNNKSKFLVEINGKHGVVDINGEIIIPPIYNKIVEISNSKFFAFQDCELKILNLTRYN